MNSEVIYSPDYHRRKGIAVWIGMFRQLYENRYLLKRLAIKNITVRYKKSWLSYLWVVATPLLTALIFAFIASRRIVQFNNPAYAYVVFALLNITLWQLFANTVKAATVSLSSAQSLVTRVNMPREILLLASCSEPLVQLMIRLLPVLVVFMLYDVPMLPGLPAALLFMIPLMLMALGLGFILSVINLVTTDIHNLVSLLLLVGMFLTPVLYAEPTGYPFVLLNFINPVSPVLISVHDLIAFGALQKPGLAVFCWLQATLVFLIGFRFFNLALPRVVERA